MANLKISGMLVAIYIRNLCGGTIFTNLGMKAVNIIMHHLHLLMFGSWGFVDSVVSILWFAVLVMALCLVNTYRVSSNTVSNIKHLDVVVDGCC